MTLSSDLESAVEEAFQRAAEIYLELVREHPDMPFDTGQLRDGVDIVRLGAFDGTIESTATSEDGVDYGTILNNSTGQHAGWWESVTEDGLWDQAVAQAFDELGL